jgi:hypothetical protein
MDLKLKFSVLQFRFLQTLLKDAAGAARLILKRFLEIAIGSTYELETQLTIAESVRLVSKEKINPLLELVTEEQKMLNSFILSVRGRNMKSSITQNLKPD